MGQLNLPPQTIFHKDHSLIQLFILEEMIKRLIIWARFEKNVPDPQHAQNVDDPRTYRPLKTHQRKSRALNFDVLLIGHVGDNDTNCPSNPGVANDSKGFKGSIRQIL